MPKPLTVWITINCGKFWKRWEYQTTWPASWEICMQVKWQPTPVLLPGESHGERSLVGYNPWSWKESDTTDWLHFHFQEATVRTGHGTTDWFQIGKRVRQGWILSPCLFNLYAEYIKETMGWKKHKLESRLQGEISITSDMQMTPPLWQKVKRN